VFFRQARESGQPVCSTPNFLDSCLRRNDGLYRNIFPECSIKIYAATKGINPASKNKRDLSKFKLQGGIK